MSLLYKNFKKTIPHHSMGKATKGNGAVKYFNEGWGFGSIEAYCIRLIIFVHATRSTIKEPLAKNDQSSL